MTKLLFLVLTSCATTYAVRPGDLPPAVSRVPADQRVAVWNRAIGVLLDHGYVAQLLDQNGGYISAKQRDDSPDARLAGTYAIVVVAPDGAVRVELGGIGTYHSLGEMVRDLHQLENQLVSDIIGT